MANTEKDVGNNKDSKEFLMPNLDRCYEQVFDVTNNPDVVEVAELAGGLIAGGAAAALSAKDVVSNPTPVSIINAAKDVRENYEAGATHGRDILIPLFAVSTYASCVFSDAVSNTFDYLYSQFESATSSTPDTSHGAAQDTPESGASHATSDPGTSGTHDGGSGSTGN